MDNFPVYIEGLFFPITLRGYGIVQRGNLRPAFCGHGKALTAREG